MWKFRLGLILIAIAVLIFLMLFALPFLSISLKLKLTLTPVFLVAGEVTFWLGILLVGKDVYLKFKEKLTSTDWRGKKNKNPSDPE